jgi:DNA anti-recombination protein RmuC
MAPAKPTPSKPAARAASATPDANRAVQDVLKTIDAVHSVYAEENAALNAADTQKFLEVQDRKIEAVRKYQADITELMSRKEEIKSRLDPRLRHILKMKQEEFDSLTRENLEHLERMRKCAERMGKRIMQAARETAKKDTHAYGAQGHLANADRRVSLGLNESA